MSKWCFSLCLLISLGLKSILLDIKKAIIACFLIEFDGKTFFQPFILRLKSILDVKVCFLDAAAG